MGAAFFAGSNVMAEISQLIFHKLVDYTMPWHAYRIFQGKHRAIPTSCCDCKDGPFSPLHTCYSQGRVRKKNCKEFFSFNKINLLFFTFKWFFFFFNIHTPTSQLLGDELRDKKECASHRHRAAVVLLVVKGEMHNCVIFTEVQACKFSI